MSDNKRITRVVIIAVILLALAAVFTGWATRSTTVILALDGQSGRVQWSTWLKGYDAGDPVAEGDRIFVDILTGQAEGTTASTAVEWDLVALDAQSGRQLWRTDHQPTDYNGEVNRYAPLANNDLVIDDLYHDTLAVYDAGSGESLYQLEGVMVWGMIGDDALPVALSDDWLIARRQHKSMTTNGVQVYDLNDGSLLWSTPYDPYPGTSDNAANFTPVLAYNDRVYLEVASRYQVFDIASGDLLFALDQTCKQARIQDSTLYCISGDLKAYDATSGDLLWLFYPDNLGDINLQEVEVGTDAIYVTTTALRSRPYKQWIIALDPTDGSERWRVQIWDGRDDNESLWHVSPAAGEEMVFAIKYITNRKALIALSAADGTQLWQFPLYSEHRYAPVADGEQVYIVDAAARWRHWIARPKSGG